MLSELQPLLRTRRLGRAAEYHVEVDSTNRRALEWAAAGAPDGALVLADHQTAGRGRRGRSWSDQPGANLLFSVVLRPGLPHERLGLIGLAAAVAAAEAIALLTSPVAPTLKWPNDVLLDGRKTCGILSEARVRGDERAIALGIGLNVNQTDFPPDIEATATSLRLVTGRDIDRTRFLATLLEALERWDDRLRVGEEAAVIDAFTERIQGIGQPATIALPGGGETDGIIEGLDVEGALLLRGADGLRRYHAGEVSIRSPSPHAP